MIYDFIRIYHFKEIFVTSVNYEFKLESINFLKKYLLYLNIEFDNENRRIIDIDFKNKNKKNKSYNKYNNFLKKKKF